MDRPPVRLRQDHPERYRGVLVRDGECPFCSAAATALRRVPGVGALSHYEEPAQRFLAAPFEADPLALGLADVGDGRVHVGREAASELCDRAGLPVVVSDLVGDDYESVADAVRTVAGVDREPDPYHDVVPLADDARRTSDDLAPAADGLPRVSSD